MWDINVLFEKHPENKTGKEFFNSLNICSVYFGHGIAITFPVPAGIGDQGVNMRIPVGHAPEGLGYDDSTGKNIFAIKCFMKEHCKRIPRASAEYCQEFPVMQKMQPEHLRNTTYPVTVGNRAEKLLLKENCHIQ